MIEDKDSYSKAAIRRLERAARANNTFYIQGLSEHPPLANETTSEEQNKPKIRRKITKRKLAPQPRPSIPKKTLHIAPRPQPSIFEIVPPPKQIHKTPKAAKKKQVRKRSNQPRVYTSNLVSTHSAKIISYFALGLSDETIKQELDLGDRAIRKTFERLANILSKKLNIAKINTTRSKILLYLIENGNLDLSELRRNNDPSVVKLAKNMEPDALNILLLQAHGLTENEIASFLHLKPAEIRKQNAILCSTFELANKEAVFVALMLNGLIPSTAAEIEVLVKGMQSREKVVELSNHSNLKVEFKNTAAFNKLNHMQKKVLAFIVHGYNSDEISDMMNIQKGTVIAARYHIKNLLGSRTLATGIIEMIKNRELILDFDVDIKFPQIDVTNFKREELELLNSIVDLSFFDMPAAKRHSPEAKLMKSLVSKLRIREIYNLRQIPTHEHCLVIEGYRNGLLPHLLAAPNRDIKNAPQL